MIRLIALLGLTLLFAGALPTSALGATHEEDQECTLDTAVSVAIRDINTSDDLRFECVVVEGVLDGGALYASRDAMYGIGEWAAADRFVRLQRSAFPRFDGPVLVRIAGVADHCGKIYAEAEAEVGLSNAKAKAEGSDEFSIVFLGGTCHYHWEPYLDPVAISYIDFEVLKRLTQAQVDPAQSDIVEAEEDFAYDQVQLRLAELLIEAVGAGNEALFHAIRDPSNQPEGLDVMGAGAFDEFVVDRSSGWEEGLLRQGDHSTKIRRYALEEWLEARKLQQAAERMLPLAGRQRKIYGWRDWEDPAGEVLNGATDDPPTIICWCREKDCTGKWPAFYSDADARPDRPYLCVETGDYVVSRGSIRNYAELRETEYGMAEPDWPMVTNTEED